MMVPFMTRLLCTFSGYLAVLSFFKQLSTRMPLFSLLAAVCTICGGLSCRFRNNSVLRVLFGVLPLLLLFKADTVAIAVLMALPLLYTAVYCIGSIFRVERWGYATYFRWACIAMAVYQVGMVMADHQNAYMAFFGMLFFAAGAFTLRQARLGEGTDLRQRMLDTLELAVAPAMALLTALFVYLIRSYLRRIVEFLLFPFSWPIYLLIELLNRIPMENVHPEPTPTPDPSAMPKINMRGGLPSVPKAETLVPMDLYWLRDAILYLLIAVGIGLVVLYVVMTLRNRREISPDDVDLFEGSVPLERDEERVLRAQGEKGAARKVRRIYAQYLKLLTQKGHAVFPSDTSGEVYERMVDYCAETESSKALRELYIRARYRTGEPVQEEDVRRAKALLKEIQKAVHF